MITNKDIPTDRILKDIEYLCTKVKGWYTSNLTEYDKKSIINHTYMLLHTKFLKGEIPYDNYESHKAYMFIVTRNAVLRYYKYKDTAYTWRITDDLETSYSVSSEDPSPSNRIELEHIYKAIDTLPSIQKEIMCLQIQGYKQNEISVKLNITLKAVRYNLQLAKKKLKRKLGYKKQKPIFLKKLEFRQLNRKRLYHYLLTNKLTGEVIKIDYLTEVMRYIGYATTTSERVIRLNKNFNLKYSLEKVMHAEGQKE